MYSYLSFGLLIVASVSVAYPVEEDNSLPEPSLATLEYVAVISRHGSRTPLRSYPNDPYPYNNRIFWPTGPDELTYFGKKQLYKTGEALKARYEGFFNPVYYPNDTVADYNNYNRDFMSGSCLLAALYPPVGREVWNPDLIWQPIPLYLRKFDVCNLNEGNVCPVYKTESNKQIDKFNQEAANNKSASLLKTISDYTGEHLTQVSQLFDIYDILSMQEENGFKLPGWTKDVYPEPLKTIAYPYMTMQYAGSDKLLQLGAGPELKHISDLFTMKVNGTYEKNRKFYLEAAHDCTLIALLRAMGYNNPDLEIKTSAYIIFELHYLPPSYIVQVFFYRTSSDETPEMVNIASCPSPCSLENFTKFINVMNPPDWKAECQEKSKLTSSSWTFSKS